MILALPNDHFSAIPCWLHTTRGIKSAERGSGCLHRWSALLSVAQTWINGVLYAFLRLADPKQIRKVRGELPSTFSPATKIRSDRSLRECVRSWTAIAPRVLHRCLTIFITEVGTKCFTSWIAVKFSQICLSGALPSCTGEPLLPRRKSKNARAAHA